METEMESQLRGVSSGQPQLFAEIAGCHDLRALPEQQLFHFCLNGIYRLLTRWIYGRDIRFRHPVLRVIHIVNDYFLMSLSRLEHLLCT
jgi:hypothetical protein